MSGILIPGTLRYKTSLAWSTVSNNGVSSFTLLDKEIAICKVIHPYVMLGASARRITSPPGSWSAVGGLWVSGSARTPPYVPAANSQDGMRIMRVGSTLYCKAASTFSVLQAGHATTPLHGPSIAAADYTVIISLTTDTVSGAAGALSGSVSWDTSSVSGIESDATYDYQVQDFQFVKGGVVFANLQIFKPGF
jgi:hypothetical protein